MRDDQGADGSFRMGAAVLSGLAGMAVGLLLALVCDLPLARYIFGLGAAAALVGLVCPEGAMAWVEACLHFFFGFFSSAAEQPLTPELGAPAHLKAALLFGIAFAIALSLLYRW
jgi:hypothetical protein